MPQEKNLSEREKDVLQLVASGLTNREIAQKLSISPNTVKVHLSNIFEKIGVASRTEATVYAIEHRIVDVPGGEPTSDKQKSNLGRQLIGVWVAVGLLVAAILFSAFSQAFSPDSTTDAQPTADLSETWQMLMPIPETRSGMAVVVYSEELFVFAGEGPEGIQDSVYRYSPEEDAWKIMNSKPTAVTDVQGVLIGEKIYLPGGSDTSGQPVKTLEIYDPRRDTWEIGADLPIAVSGYAMADFEGLLYLFGGWDGEKLVNTVWIYDPGVDQWFQGTSMNSPRIGACAIALSDQIVVLGGEASNGKLKADAWSYFPYRDVHGENPWADFIDLPEGRAGFGAASINDSIYIFGGEVSGKGESGLFINGNGWITLETQETFTNFQTEVVALDSLLYVLHPSTDETQTVMWAYHAFYFSIYIPFVP